MASSRRFEQNALAVASAMKQVVAATEAVVLDAEPELPRELTEHLPGRSVPALIAGRARGDLW